MTWSREVVAATVGQFEPLADPERAPQMKAYMKDVAQFLGVTSGPRRMAQRKAWNGIAKPTQPELLDACSTLWRMDERE